MSPNFPLTSITLLVDYLHFDYISVKYNVSDFGFNVDFFLLSVVAETSTGCLLAGSSLGKRGESCMKYTSHI